MSDTPEYTERQLAQNWLIKNVDTVLTHCGRSNGFPNETPSPATNETAKGPPPIAITRVASDSRKSDGTVIKEEFINNDDVSTLVNAFTPTQNLQFLDVPEEVLDQLTPRIELYKSYPFPDDEDKNFDVLFRPRYPEDKPKNVALQARKNSKQTQVGITGLNIKKLGGNPAEIDSNIVVDLKISTMDLNNLFYRYRPPELGNLGDNVNAPPLVEKNGIAWIDLIKMNPSTLSTECDRVYEEPQTRVKLVVGYNKIGAEMKSVIRDALTNNAIGRQQITPDLLRQWEAAGTPISENFSQLVNSGEVEPVMDSSGLQSTGGVIDNDRIEQRVNSIIDTINQHQEIYYLNLKKHDLIVNTDLTVEMTIHFIAHGQAVQQMDHADLLDDPMLTKSLAEQDRQLKDLDAQLGAVEAVDVAENDSDEVNEPKRLENEARSAVRTRLESDRDALREAQLDDMGIRNKKLYNQIRLASSNKSRIYIIGFPQNEDGTLADASAAGVSIVNFANFAVGSPDSAARIEDRDQLDEYTAEMDEESEAAMRNEVEDLSTGHGWKVGRFVFLGDIIEAALEILAHNNLFSRSPYTDMLANLEADQQSATEEDEAVLTAMALDDTMQYPTFWEEITENGQLGDAAQKTIKRFGKFVFGDIEIPQRETDDTKRYINIADIPIDLDLFRQFWFNEVVSKPNLKRYYLKNLVNGLITRVLPEAIQDISTEGETQSAVRESSGARPKAILSFFTIKGDGTELNSSQSTRYVEITAAAARARLGQPARMAEVSEEALEGIAVALDNASDEGVSNADLDQIANDAGFGVPGASAAESVRAAAIGISYDDEHLSISEFDEEGESIGYSQPLVDASAADLDAAGVRATEDGGFQSEVADLVSFQYVDYVATNAVRSAVAASSRKYSGIGTYDVFLIHQKQQNNIQRTGLVSEDVKKGIYHFRLSSAEKKSLMNVQFKRSDLRGLAEANLLSGQGENSLGILREKYDAGLLLRGNVVYKVGSMLYIKPDSLQGTYISPSQDDQDRMSDAGVFKSAARAIGLGGYYTVVGLSHDFGSLGKGGRWRTTLDTKWNSFSYVPGMEACEPNDTVASATAIASAEADVEAEILRITAARKAAQERKDDMHDAMSDASWGGP